MHEHRLMQPARPEAARGAPPRPEIRSVADLIGMMLGAADACDLGVVEGTISHRGFTLALPDGHVRVQLACGPHVPLTTVDDVCSDQFPALPVVIPIDVEPATLRLDAGNGWGDGLVEVDSGPDLAVRHPDLAEIDAIVGRRREPEADD